MFELIDNTADVTIRVAYEDIFDLFNSLTSGFRFLMIEDQELQGNIAETHCYTFDLNEKIYRMAVDLLNSFIFEFDLLHAIPYRCNVSVEQSTVKVLVDFLILENGQTLVNIPKAATYASMGNIAKMVEITLDV